MSLRVLPAAGQADWPDSWRSSPVLAAVDRHPFTGGFGRLYYPLVLGDGREDRSFAVGTSETLLALVACTTGQGNLDWFGLPARIFAVDGATDQAGTIAAIFDHLDMLIETEGVEATSIAESPASSALSGIGLACNSRSYRGELGLNGAVDLAKGEAGLRDGLRKSFRSLVNWGRKNMTLVHINGENRDAAAFEAYRNFHRRIAGRSTRSDASWAAMRDWIFDGSGELTLGSLASGDLVAGTMVIDGTSVAYYSSGVYDRERFDKPMAHYPLYEAILRAGMRGMTTFDLGEIPQTGTASTKEQGIGYFKRGFAGSIGTSIVWRWQRSPPAPDDGEAS